MSPRRDNSPTEPGLHVPPRKVRSKSSVRMTEQLRGSHQARHGGGKLGPNRQQAVEELLEYPRWRQRGDGWRFEFFDFVWAIERRTQLWAPAKDLDDCQETVVQGAGGIIDRAREKLLTEQLVLDYEAVWDLVKAYFGVGTDRAVRGRLEAMEEQGFLERDKEERVVRFASYRSVLASPPGEKKPPPPGFIPSRTWKNLARVTFGKTGAWAMDVWQPELEKEGIVEKVDPDDPPEQHPELGHGVMVLDEDRLDEEIPPLDEWAVMALMRTP